MRRYFLLLGLSIVYLVHLWLKFGQVPVPGFFSHYFADLLCMPLLLGYALLFMRWFRGEPDLRLSTAMILAGVIYVSVVFEWILPHFFRRYTADGWDVVMYGIGGSIFWTLQDKLVPYSVKS